MITFAFRYEEHPLIRNSHGNNHLIQRRDNIIVCPLFFIFELWNQAER